MKVGKKAIYIGMILLISSFLVPTFATACKPNNVVFQFEQEFVGFGPIDEFSIDEYGVIYYVNNVVYLKISTEDCPLQGNLTSTITSYVNPGIFGLGIWYNSFEGTYNGREASYEGWTATYQGVGHGYYLGKGALRGYVVKYTIDGTSGVALITIELVRRGMKKNIDFEFVYDTIGDPESITVDDAGIWYLENTPHYGHITASSKKHFSGDIYLENDLVLLDNLMEPTTFNGFGTGLFEFDGYFQHNKVASFSGTMYFLIDDFVIMGLFLAEGEGKFKNCLITGFINAVVGGATSVEMSIYRIH